VQLLLAMLPVTDDDQPAHRVFVHLYSEGMTDPAVAAVARGYLDSGARDAQRVLEHGRREGWVAGDLDCEVAARILVSAIDSFGIQRLLDDEAMTHGALRTHVETLVGLVTKKGKETKTIS
jgi:BetI-type transcriptional repressor, C-terminal